MFRTASLRLWTRAITHIAPSTSRALPGFVRAASSSSPSPSPFSASSHQPQPGPVSQRPQKHKAKKAKAHKHPNAYAAAAAAGSSSASSSSSGGSLDAGTLLPLGLRAPTPRRRPADGKVIALTTAESYDTAELLQRLQAMGLLEDAVNLVGEAVLLPRWSPAAATFFDADSAAGAASAATLQEHGEVYVFESGTVVLWGLSMDAAEVFLRKVIRGGTHASASTGFVEVGRYAEPETEVLEYWVGEDG